MRHGTRETFNHARGIMQAQQFVTASTLSERLGLPKSTVYRMAARGLIPSVPWGVKLSGRRFSEQEVRSALARLQARPSDHDQTGGNLMPKRIQLSRKKGWRKPARAVVVARPSKWGNPFKVGEHGTHAECIALYRDYLPGSGLPVEELRGKDLACWCPLGGPCHGDILLEAANG